MKISEKNQKWIILLGSILYVIAAHFISSSFFTPIKANTGSENKAYAFLETGLTLENDSLSKIFCWLFACTFACTFLFAFCSWIVFLYRTWKRDETVKKYILLLIAINLLGILFLICFYPLPISLSPDTYYNYIYAREWLPMYWHGFLTNVVYCACCLIIPHPFSMTLIPFLIAINLLGYFLYCGLIKNGKKGFRFALLFAAFLFVMPETIQIFTFVGRNYMYGIVSFSFLCIFFLDNLKKKELTLPKCVVLSVLLAVLATWRTEGIIWLLFFPFLFYFTYFYKRNVPNALRRFLLVALAVVLCYSVFNVPVKYGNEKYQGSDYFIINLPGPVSAVLNNPKANLTYEGAEEDLSTIDSVIPLEYIKKYGEYGSIYYNYANGRAARQCDVGSRGKDFVVASYSLLFHNLDIYLKFQTNLFCESLFLPTPFSLPYVEEPWVPEGESLIAYNTIMDYYNVGEKDILETHGITFIHPSVDAFADLVIQTIMGYAYLLTGYIKLITTLVVLFIGVHSLFKKRWLYFFTSVAVIGILFAIILTAPTARTNYYFYPFFNQYWLILFYLLQLKQDKQELSA